MRTFIIIMWILNLNTLEGHKQEWNDYNEQHKDSYAGCYPESIRPPYIPERKKEDL